MTSSKNKLFIVLGIIFIALVITVFVIWNVIWFSFVEENYTPYLNITVDPLVPDLSASYKNGYSFSVNKPSYLSFEGNLGVSDENFNLLLVFPKYNSEPVYSIILDDSYTGSPIIIDSSGNLKDDLTYPEDISNSILKNQHIIKELICYYDEWKNAAKNGTDYFSQPEESLSMN